MDIYAFFLIAFSLKLAFSFFIYKKNKESFTRMSLPTKGAVIGGGWLACYGLFQLFEGLI